MQPNSPQTDTLQLNNSAINSTIPNTATGAFSFAWRSPLARKLIAQTIFFSSLLTLIFTGIQLYGDFVYDLEEIENAISEIESSRVQSIVESVWVIDDEHIQTQLDGIAGIKDVQFVGIYGKKGDLKWSAGTIVDEAEPYSMLLAKPSFGKLYELGVLQVTPDIAAIHSRLLNNAMKILLVNAIKAALVACFFVTLFYRSIGSHLAQISAYAKRYQFGHRPEPLVLARQRSQHDAEDELQVLVGSLNSLIDGTENQREERAKIEILTIQQRDALERTNTQLEAFTYRTSHDLRAPIVSSLALIELAQSLLETGEIEKTSSGLRLASRSLQTLRELIDNLIEITALKNREEAFVEVNVNKVVNESLQLLSNLAQFERLQIENNCAESLTVLTKKLQFRTVIENLLSNAIKYQDPAEPRPSIVMSSSIDDDCFIFKITDNGLGIPEKHEKDMFQMFKRFHASVSFGSGMGMYLIKLTVEGLGGKITYRRPDKGCCLIVRLPMGSGNGQ